MLVPKHYWIYTSSLLFHLFWCILCISFVKNDSQLWMLYVAFGLATFCFILRVWGTFAWDPNPPKTWIGILHTIGLTNLSDEQVRQYEDKNCK